MPTPFALVLLALVALLAVAGVVVWVRRSGRRGGGTRTDHGTHSSHPEAPWSAEQSATYHHRAGGGGNAGGWGG